jgi:hypothetical protein
MKQMKRIENTHLFVVSACNVTVRRIATHHVQFFCRRSGGGAVKRYSAPSGGGSVNQGGIWRYYTDDAAGLKM